MNWTVATFNVNSVRSRIEILRRWLNDNKVDVLCLQETKTVDETFPENDFKELGYSVVYRGQKSYNGVAVASLSKPDEVLYGFNDGQEPCFDTRIISVRFGNVWIINSYVPQGKSIDHDDYQVKKSFLRRIRKFIESLKFDSYDVLWVGDLNVAPDNMDTTNPDKKKKHVCFHQEIKDVFAETRDGFVDIFRKYRPDAGEFSFWDYRVKNALERNIGWRIDHILSTGNLAARSIDSYVDREPRSWEKPSDHTPMLAIFSLEK